MSGLAASKASYSVQSYQPSRDSACVDAGTATGAPADDLLGFARPCDVPSVGNDGTADIIDVGGL